MSPSPVKRRKKWTVSSLWNRSSLVHPYTPRRSFVAPMDKISIKTPNPKCSLYWWLIEFIEWRYSQSCWYFRPLLWTSAPLTFSMFHLPPPLPPFPMWISTGVCIYTVCNGGKGSGCGESKYRIFTLCIWPDSEPTKWLYRPKQKPRTGRATDR